MQGLPVAQYLATCAASGAYLLGFAAGADVRRRRRRHVVNPATHAHWMRGYEAGRAAVAAADHAYTAELVAHARATAEASS